MQERLAGTAELCGFNLAFVVLDACLAHRRLRKLKAPTPLKWRGNQDPEPFLANIRYLLWLVHRELHTVQSEDPN